MATFENLRKVMSLPIGETKSQAFWEMTHTLGLRLGRPCQTVGGSPVELEAGTQ